MLLWLGGIALYPAGNVLLALLTLQLARTFAFADGAHRGRAALLAAALVVLTIGANETVMTLAVAFIVLALAAALVFQRRAAAALGALLLLVAAAASWVVISAPGNRVRASFFGPRLPLLSAAWQSLRQAAELAVSWSLDPLLIAVTLLSLPGLALCASRLRRVHPLFRSRWRLPFAIVFALSIMALSLFPSWSVRAVVVPQTLSITYALFLVGWSGAVGIATSHLRRPLRLRRRRAVTLGLEAAVVVAVVSHGWLRGAFEELRVSAPIFRRQVEERYALIEAARRRGESSLVVQRITEHPPDLFVLQITACPDSWPNNSYAEYFGLESIRVPGDPLACPRLPPEALTVVNPYSLHLFRHTQARP